MGGDIANLGAIINVVSGDKHVPKIERYNPTITIKKCIRAQYNMLPFTYVLSMMIVELVYSPQVFGRNMSAIKGGVSATQSPSEIFSTAK